MGVAHHLATELDAAAVGELDLLDAAADPGPRLEHRDLCSACLEVARGGQPGQTGAHDHDVRTAHVSTTADPRIRRSPGPVLPLERGPGS